MAKQTETLIFHLFAPSSGFSSGGFGNRRDGDGSDEGHVGVHVGVTFWEGAHGGQVVSGNVYVPQQPENFQYDADGNLTNDGRWQYVWDAENRLITMIVNTNVGPQYKLAFAYDPEGRRISKVVSTNGVVISTNIFLYDGWNLVATISPSDALINSFMWGPDLSGQAGGALNGAGGVGGLLEATYYGASTTNCFPAYDGNGNIMALVNAANGQIVANYEYGPFGEVVRTTGPMAKANPFRFSTKYQDNESDLLYYGYRYYLTSSGTWVNRDPLLEKGCINLYTFCFNTPLNSVDVLGGESMEYQGTIDMFLNYWSDNGEDGGLSDELTSEVMANPTVVGFEDSLLARAKASLKCGAGGAIKDRIYLGDFNPNWTWILTGNWQLSLAGRADWNCKNGCSCCDCFVKVQIVGMISKLYTFYHHPGGNPADILTELPALIGTGLLGSQEYYIDQPLSYSAGQTMKHCGKK